MVDGDQITGCYAFGPVAFRFSGGGGAGGGGDAPYLGGMALRASYRNNEMPTALADSAVAEEYAQIAAALRRSLREFGREAA